MRLYDNAIPNFEQIKTWYPIWYQRFVDMVAIWRATGKQFDRIQTDIARMVENVFAIDYMDAETITRLEEFLKIVHPLPRTLVERRTVLKGVFIMQGHIGRPEIIELISMFTDGNIEVAFWRGVITVTVDHDYGDMFSAADIYMILGRPIPAHLQLDIVDITQPVSAVNHNRFIFRDLLMFQFKIVNRTARFIGEFLNGERILDGSWWLGGSNPGINLVDFHVRARVQNFRADTLLNGERILDGSWELSFGRKFRTKSIKMTGYKVENQNTVSGTFKSERKWFLDGTYKLDGTNPVGNIHSEEVL